MIGETRQVTGYLLLSGVVLTFVTLLGLKTLLVALIGPGVFLFITWTMNAKMQFIAPNAHQSELNEQDENGIGTLMAYLLLLLGLCITLGQEIVYVRDFLDGGDYYRMNTVFKFSMQAWLCFAIGGALAMQRLWHSLGGIVRRTWSAILIALVLSYSIFLIEGPAARINDHQSWVNIQAPVQSANYIPTLDGFAFGRAWYPVDARAITWLNDNVAGSPVVLEAAAPVSYQWFNRISVYTGLPDVLGWPDHVGEQRYDDQPINRAADITIICTTSDEALAVELLRYYHVRYIYVGSLEQQLYGQSSSIGLKKFDAMVGNTLHLVYRSGGVTIYEVL